MGQRRPEVNAATRRAQSGHMSAVVETLIVCDGNDLGVACPQRGCYSDGDTRHERASTIRKRYGGDGWVYRRGKDFCPHCAVKLFPKRKVGT